MTEPAMTSPLDLQPDVLADYQDVAQDHQAENRHATRMKARWRPMELISLYYELGAHDCPPSGNPMPNGEADSLTQLQHDLQKSLS
jgi:hypothetical protein